MPRKRKAAKARTWARWAIIDAGEVALMHPSTTVSRKRELLALMRVGGWDRKVEPFRVTVTEVLPPRRSRG